MAAVGCAKLTQHDIDRSCNRFLILFYEITENDDIETAYELISGVEQTLNKEFSDDLKTYRDILSRSSCK